MVVVTSWEVWIYDGRQKEKKRGKEKEKLTKSLLRTLPVMQKHSDIRERA